MAKDPWPWRSDWQACPPPQWPKAPVISDPTSLGPAQGERVLVIGDSITREGRKPLLEELRKDGWTPTIRCWGGKRLDWAIEQAQRAKRLGQLPDVVVIAIGTNDMRWIDRQTTRSRMGELIDILGPDRTVLWMDTYAQGGERFDRKKERWFNREVDRLDRANKNIHRIDWGSFARKSGVKFADPLHYTVAGERTWAKRIAWAVTRIAVKPPVQPEQPAPDVVEEAAMPQDSAA